MAKTKCADEAAKALLAETLEGCTPEEVRQLMWEVAERGRMNPTEILGLDVDVGPAGDED